MNIDDQSIELPTQIPPQQLKDAFTNNDMLTPIILYQIPFNKLLNNSSNDDSR